MWRLFLRFLLFASLLILSESIAAAQTGVPQVTISGATVQPGDAITLPIWFAPGQLGIREMKLTVKYRGAILRFEKVDRDRSTADVQVEDYVEAKQSDEFSYLTLTATAFSRGGSEMALTDGTLGKLTFRLNDPNPDTDGAAINLYLTAEATAVGSNDPLPTGAVRSPDSVVYEVGPNGGMINMNCLFFSH